METKVVRSTETRVFLEGSEVCREYFRTDKILFGSSTLLPGQTGAVDPGHPVSHEVFYVSRGRVLVSIADDCFELGEGDAVVIPEGKPHQLTNIGEEKALIVWSCAPTP